MNQQLVNLLKKSLIPAAVGVITLSGGFAGGYILGRRKIRADLKEARRLLDEYIQDEASSIENFTQQLKEARELRDEARDLTLKAFAERPDLRPDPKDIIVEERPNGGGFAKYDASSFVNVITTVDDDWDYEAEQSSRSSTEPYVIHQDEFMADDMGFTQYTWTYYQGDDILVDQDDVPVYNHAETVGELKFGHGSKDRTVVYIRNEALQREYEILADERHYRVVVLDLQIEEELETNDLKHSSTIPRFRQDTS